MLYPWISAPKGEEEKWENQSIPILPVPVFPGWKHPSPTINPNPWGEFFPLWKMNFVPAEPGNPPTLELSFPIIIGYWTGSSFLCIPGLSIPGVSQDWKCREGNGNWHFPGIIMASLPLEQWESQADPSGLGFGAGWHWRIPGALKVILFQPQHFPLSQGAPSVRPGLGYFQG